MSGGAALSLTPEAVSGEVGCQVPTPTRASRWRSEGYRMQGEAAVRADEEER